MKVEEFSEMRKPSYKIEVDLGPIIGSFEFGFHHQLSSSRVIGRTVVGALNLATRRYQPVLASSLSWGPDPDGTVRLLELPEGVKPVDGCVELNRYAID